MASNDDKGTNFKEPETSSADSQKIIPGNQGQTSSNR